MIETLPKIETRGHLVLSLIVMSTTAPLDIQQMADGTSEEDFASVLVLKLVETATSTTVAKRLPLRLREFT
jgi:hypothetical protein